MWKIDRFKIGVKITMKQIFTILRIQKSELSKLGFFFLCFFFLFTPPSPPSEKKQTVVRSIRAYGFQNNKIVPVSTFSKIHINIAT